MNLHNRTISRQHFEALHPGLVRLAKFWHWRIVDSPDADDPTLITLRDLALEPEPEASPEEPTLEEPTLEQWLAAGYPANRYEDFVRNHSEAEKA